MKTLFISSLALFFSVLNITSVSADTPPAVSSREYKLMLQPSLFNGNNPVAMINTYWNDLKTVINTVLSRSTSGNFMLSHQRIIRFYDTLSSCLLNRNNLIFRERIEGDQREVTLKYRSPDRFIAAYQDMSAIAGDAETKFEEDLSAPFISKYSHSTTQNISSSKNLNRMDDPIGLYPGLLSYQFDDTLPIAIVGNLTITEQVYQGPSIDLGSKNGEFSLTLWYANGNTGAPVVAEISFKYADANEDYSENVVARAKILFELMQTMDTWQISTALTKTAYVYGYNPSFCQ